MKKNLFTSVFILLLISSIGFYACSDDITTIESDETVNAKNTRTNPLEYIGIEHNVFMESFTRKLEESHNSRGWHRVNFLSDDYKTTFASVMNEAYRERYTQTNSTVDYQIEVYDRLNLKEWFDRDATTSIDIAEGVLRDTATDRDREFTMNLLNDLYNAINSAQTDAEAFNNIGDVVTRHESLILSQNWSAGEEYALGAVAVAKYSAEFWKNYDFSRYNSGARLDDVNPRSGVIVGADTAGYVVGGVVGGTGGSFAGPAGTVGGVLGGKAAGAWIGSGAAATAFAIYDAWSDFFD